MDDKKRLAQLEREFAIQMALYTRGNHGALKKAQKAAREAKELRAKMGK